MNELVGLGGEGLQAYVVRTKPCLPGDNPGMSPWIAAIIIISPAVLHSVLSFWCTRGLIRKIQSVRDDFNKDVNNLGRTLPWPR